MNRLCLTPLLWMFSQIYELPLQTKVMFVVGAVIVAFALLTLLVSFMITRKSGKRL